MIPLIQLKKALSRSGFSSPRVVIAVLLCAAAASSMVSGTLPAFFRPEAETRVSDRTLTFVERVAYQKAIEDVY